MDDILTNRLRRERERRNFKKYQAAKFLEIKNSTYGHYEQGKRRPDIATLLHIANRYEVSVDYLLGKSHYRNAQAGPDMQAILDLTDDEIVKSVQFKVDSQTLSESQVQRLIAFVRAERFVGKDDRQQGLI